MMSDDPYNVLFLSNRNTARSIFAEAVTNRLGQKRFRGFSAGITPAEKIDPLVFDVLKAAEYSTDGLRPKYWEEFAKADAPPPLDFVFTLCDPMAGEPLPHWPGRPITADWRYPDPENIHGEEWQQRKALAQILAGLERQFRAFMNLPFKSLDEISLRARLGELGQTKSYRRSSRHADSTSASP